MIIFYMGKKKTLLFKFFHGTKDVLNVRLMNECLNVEYVEALLEI